MSRPVYIPPGLLLVALVCTLNSGSAQDSRPGAQPSAKLWLEQRQAEFEQYDFATEAAEPRKLTLESRSLLNWSNAERGADVGAVYLWTIEGLPQLIACAFGRGKFLRHEFHSLSTASIVAKRDGSEVHRFEPGIAWQELPAAPPPAKQRALRLAQMRRQAERFRVVLGDKVSAELRLLTQPVFRTSEKLDDDVALFVFVQGTDPECVLLVQITAEGNWQYAITRQSKWPFKVEFDGNQVAEFPSIGRTPSGSPFAVLTPPAADE